MHSVTISHNYDQPAGKVWEALDNFGDVQAYHPLVKESSIINGQGRGKGAERVCHFKDGNSIRERIIDYTADKNYQVEIFDMGNFPLKKAIAHLEVSEQGPDASSVTFKIDFQPKFGFIGTIMAKMMMEKQFGKTLDMVLTGLEKHVGKEEKD